ncbi:hypothetical protein [Mesorhizobium sp.]|uniref:hypothetical protein n=1 Tax=Mesorhizobium sp. TaxID=1871066 RepID=UPI000FE56526|nr:hypothetical protein [Mesorhizobium sp.]RWM39904.1 MAG: hypothetical protein EOR75_12040 [Mesorhizobium sp.]
MIDWTDEVFFIAIEPSTPEMPARPGWPKLSPSRFSGEYLRAIGSVYADEINEGPFLHIERAYMRPVAVTPQPETLYYQVAGRIRRYIPDFLIEEVDGRASRVEVKGVAAFLHQEWLPAKLAAIGRAYSQVGLLYRVIMATNLRKYPYLENADILRAGRIASVPGIIRSNVSDLLSLRAKTLGEILNHVPACSREHLYALHLDRDLSIDLDCLITDQSIVRVGSTSGLPFWESHQ